MTKETEQTEENFFNTIKETTKKKAFNKKARDLIYKKILQDCNIRVLK